MPAYIAREPIEHDGKRTEPGCELNLTAEQAAPLLLMGHVVQKSAGKSKISAVDTASDRHAPSAAG